MSDETKPDSLEREKLELERAKFEFEKEKLAVERMRASGDVLRAGNESIDRLLSTIRYLNEIQDGQMVKITGVVEETWHRQGREWNPHEEEIANYCLMALKQQAKLRIVKE